MKTNKHTQKLDMKKKIELLDSKPNKKTLAEKKPPLKADLIVQLKALEIENNNLKDLHNSDLETIQILNEKVARLENNKSSLSERSMGCQTFCNEIRISCNNCIFVATGEDELNFHMFEAHDLPDESYFDKDFYCKVCCRWCTTEKELAIHMQDHTPVHQKSMEIESYDFSCNFCEERFTKRGGLMIHKKKKHTDKVAICRQNSSGQCGYGDNLCWFLHCESADESLAAANIKCNFCEKEFQFRSQLLRHKKQKHWDSVSICRNEEQNNCKFGSKNCWFKHENEKIIKEHDEKYEEMK